MTSVVYQGELELANANWSLGSGRTVDFWLHDQKDLAINPFKVYQKRRNGKVGQRFQAAIVPVGFEIPAYSGELMLAAWADTDKGKSVRFWLDEEASLHPFAGYNKRDAKNSGQRFMAALSLIDEEGRPLDPDRVDEMEARGARKRTRSQDVHLIVTGHKFMEWMLKYEGEIPNGGPKQRVKDVLNIVSLAELDTNEIAYKHWIDYYWRPFSRWATGEDYGDVGSTGMAESERPPRQAAG